MQMNFDRASAGARTAALPNVTTLAIDYEARRNSSSPVWETARLRERRQQQRDDALENMVWLAVGLCAVATLAVSFFA